MPGKKLAASLVSAAFPPSHLEQPRMFSDMAFVPRQRTGGLELALRKAQVHTLYRSHLLLEPLTPRDKCRDGLVSHLPEVMELTFQPRCGLNL